MLRAILCIVFCLTFFGCEKPRNISSPEPADVAMDVATDTTADPELSLERVPINVPDSKVFKFLKAEMEPTGFAEPFSKTCFNSDVPVGGRDFMLINCRGDCCTFAILNKDHKDTGCREQWCTLDKPCSWVAYKKPWCGAPPRY